LNSLQRDALAAMQDGDHDRAIQYLQRAIRIEPRNPVNWHYLAQSYRAQYDFARCREMISRSRAYSSYDSILEQANQILAAQCVCKPGERCE
jgi:predicted Zn-dependent protease